MHFYPQVYYSVGTRFHCIETWDLEISLKSTLLESKERNKNKKKHNQTFLIFEYLKKLKNFSLPLFLESLLFLAIYYIFLLATKLFDSSYHGLSSNSYIY